MATLVVRINFPDAKRADMIESLRLRYPLDPDQTAPYTDQELEAKFAADCAALLNRYDAKRVRAAAAGLGATAG